MSRKSKALEFVQEEFDIKITGRHVEVTDAMKDYCMEKISKIERFTDRILDVSVMMDVQKHEHKVEIIMKMGHTRVVSHAATTDMYASIDSAVNKIETQLLKYKNRIQNHHAKKISVVDMEVDVVQHMFEEEEEVMKGQSGDENAPGKFNFHKIVSKDTLPLKVLTYDEALMKMELSSDVFMIFRHEEDMKLKVIYRREDDHFGIIEPRV